MPPQFENNNVQSINTEKHHHDPTILLTLVVAMVLCGAGAVWYISNLPPEPAPQPITKVDQFADTNNWKTYRNEEYGFEFKYPADEYYLEDLKDFSSNTLVSLYNIESKKISDECECGEVERFQVSYYKKDSSLVYSERDPVLRFDHGDNFFLVSNSNKDILSTFKFTK